jgi:hypothetical protein
LSEFEVLIISAASTNLSGSAPNTFLMARCRCALPTPANSNFKQQIQLHGLAALVARGLPRSLAPRSEGAGNAGCALHPRSRVQKAERKTHTSIQVQRRHPTFPAQWLYGLFRALPGDQACLTPSPSDMAHLRPVGPTGLRRLDADHEASEPRDFTVRTAPFVSLPPIAHGVYPALPSRVTPDAAASTASRSQRL